MGHMLLLAVAAAVAKAVQAPVAELLTPMGLLKPADFHTSDHQIRAHQLQQCNSSGAALPGRLAGKYLLG